MLDELTPLLIFRDPPESIEVVCDCFWGTCRLTGILVPDELRLCLVFRDPPASIEAVCDCFWSPGRLSGILVPIVNLCGGPKKSPRASLQFSYYVWILWKRWVSTLHANSEFHPSPSVSFSLDLSLSSSLPLSLYDIKLSLVYLHRPLDDHYISGSSVVTLLSNCVLGLKGRTTIDGTSTAQGGRCSRLLLSSRIYYSFGIRCFHC